MKRMMMLALTAMFVVLAANAKDDKVTLTSGDGKMLIESSKKATIDFDYSKTIAEDKPIKQYLKERGAEVERGWPEVAKAAKTRFIERFNSKNKKGVQIVEAGAADLKMKVVVEKLHLGSTATAVVFGGLGSAGGAEITGKLIVTDAKTKKVVAVYEIFEVRGNGSTDFTEGKRLGTCYENVAKMILKASK